LADGGSRGRIENAGSGQGNEYVLTKEWSGEHERLDLRFNDITEEIPGMRAPAPEDVAALLRFGRDLMRERGAHLLVHCHMGISRSTAAMALILAQARPDRPGLEALAEVRRIRERIWPNLRLVELGDAALGRKGDLVAAVLEHRRPPAEVLGTALLLARKTAREVKERLEKAGGKPLPEGTAEEVKLWKTLAGDYENPNGLNCCSQTVGQPRNSRVSAAFRKLA